MAVANDPKIIHKPIPLGTDARIDLDIFSDDLRTTRRNLTGKTVTAWIKDPGGSWVTYTATVDVAATGDAHIILASANHVTVGTADLRVHADGQLTYPIYQFDFIEEAAAA